MFTTREMATATLVLLIFLVALWKSKDRCAFLGNFVDILKAALPLKVSGVLVIYGLLIAAITWLISLAGLWEWGLLKETVIVSVFTGIPLMIFRSLQVGSGAQLFRGVWKECLGFAAFVGIYMNLYTFSFIAELFLQAWLMILLLLIAVTKGQPDAKKVGLLSNILIFITVSMVALRVFSGIRSEWREFDWLTILKEFAISVCIPLMMLPFAYLFAFIAASESSLVRLKVFNKEVKTSVRLAVFVGFRFSLRYAKCFRGQWLDEAAKSPSFREIPSLMQRYRRTVRQRIQANKDRERRIKQFTGVVGKDPHGRWLDRREFHETKEALEHIFYVQMGQFRNRGQGYLDDKLVLFRAGGFEGLPDDPEIQVNVREDRKAWFAWRRTVGGCYLAVGGNEDLDRYWRYSAAEPPDSYPGGDSRQWGDPADDEGVPDWVFDDAPYPSS